MKQKNEEILQRWRNLGFLKGLKEGSINEWRCAKSFDNIANYCIEHDAEYNYSMAIASFGIIRKVLCTGKKRLHRIIDAEIFVDFYKTDTVLDCIKHISKLKCTEKEIECIRRFVSYCNGWEMSIGSFLEGIMAPPDNIENRLTDVANIITAVIDLEAIFVALAAEQFMTHFVDKLSDVLNVGDEFETDKGEKMKVIGIDENGDVLTKIIVN